MMANFVSLLSLASQYYQISCIFCVKEGFSEEMDWKIWKQTLVKYLSLNVQLLPAHIQKK